MSNSCGISLLVQAASSYPVSPVPSMPLAGPREVKKQKNGVQARVADAATTGFSSAGAAVKKKAPEKTPLSPRAIQPDPVKHPLSEKSEVDLWLRTEAQGKSGEELREVLIEARKKYDKINVDCPFQGMISHLNLFIKPGEPRYSLPEGPAGMLDSGKQKTKKTPSLRVAPRKQSHQSEDWVSINLAGSFDPGIYRAPSWIDLSSSSSNGHSNGQPTGPRKEPEERKEGVAQSQGTSSKTVSRKRKALPPVPVWDSAASTGPRSKERKPTEEEIDLQLLKDSEGKAGEELNRVIETAQAQYASIGIKRDFEETISRLDELCAGKQN